MKKEEKKVYAKPAILAFERIEGQQAILAISKPLSGTLRKQYIDENVESDVNQTTDVNHGYSVGTDGTTPTNSYFGF